MIQHRAIRDRLPLHAIALLAAALIACGTLSGRSAGRPAEVITSEAPSDVHLTEFDYPGQTAAPAAAQTATEAGPSEATGTADGPYLVP